MWCFIVLIFIFVHSDVRYVSQDEATGGDPCSFATPCGFAEALGIAQDGDSIYVFNGVYSFDLLDEKNIDIELTIEGETRDEVFLEGNVNFIVDSGKPFSLRHLSVRNMNSSFLLVGSSGLEDVLVEDVSFISVESQSVEDFVIDVDTCSTLTFSDVFGEEIGISDGSFISISEGCDSFILMNSSFDNTNSGGRFGRIYKTNSIIISNSTFRGSTTDPYKEFGGAFYIDTFENIYIEDCIFVACSVDPNYRANYGGALYIIYGDNVYINDSIFVNCSAFTGGGIYFQSLETTRIENSQFLSCFSQTFGGGIYYYNTSLSVITGCTFGECGSIQRGGAFASSEAQDGAFIVMDTDFKSCYSVQGGALHVNNIENVNVTGCSFEECEGSNGGGAIYFIRSGEECSLNVASSVFRTCTSSGGNGGAIFVEIEIVDTEKNISTYITDCDFEACESTSGYGGAIYLTHSVEWCDAYITDCSFAECKASEGGALSLNNGKNAYITKSVFEDCRSDQNGGAVRIKDCNNVELLSSSFVSCSSGSEGGAVYMQEIYSVGVFVDTSFASCSAYSGGGCLSIGSNSYSNQFEFEGCVFNNCTTDFGLGGGGILVGNALKVSNSSFWGCHSENGGGGIEYGSELFVSNSSFVECTAMEGGGGVHGLDGNTEIDSSTFISCVAGSSGGGVYIETYGNLIVSDSTFMNNSASSGAGISSESLDCVVEVKKSQFRENFALEDGGAILLIHALFGLESCEFESNYAVGEGGSVWAKIPTFSGSNYIDNSVFTYDRAGKNGGSLAITSDYFGSELSVSNSKFRTITSLSGNGGAIWLKGVTSVSFNTVTMSNCSSTNGYGGALFIETSYSTSSSGSSCNISVYDTVVERCKAKIDGGGFYISIENAPGFHFIEDTIFKKNLAEQNGGCLYLEDSNSLNDEIIGTWTLTGNEFLQCQSSLGDGGGIYVDSVSLLLVSDSLISECSAVSGGGIHLNQPDIVSLDSTTVEYCSGSGIYVGKYVTESLTLNQSTFLGNEALEKGAALYGTFTSISYLSDTSEGGALKCLEIIDSSFEDNQVMSFENCHTAPHGIVIHAISLVSAESEAGSFLIDGLEVSTSTSYEGCSPIYFETWQSGEIKDVVTSSYDNIDTFYLWIDNIAFLDIHSITFAQGFRMNSLIYNRITEDSFITLNGLENSIQIRDSDFRGNTSFSSSSNTFFDITSMNVSISRTTIVDGGVTVGGHVTISECIFENNCRIFTTETQELTVEDNLFMNCGENKIIDIIEDSSSTYTLYFGDGIRFRRNDFQGNFYGTVFKFGGKGSVDIKDIDIRDKDISSTDDDSSSGAFLYFYDVGGNVNLENCFFSNLTISSPGMFVVRIGSLRSLSHEYTVRNVSILNTQVTDSTSGMIKSGFVEEITSEEFNLFFINCFFENNVNYKGRGVVINVYGKLSFRNTLFDGNSAYEGSNIFSEGGIISLEGNTSFTRTYTEYSLTSSGGIHIFQGVLEIHDNVVFNDSDLSCVYLYDSRSSYISEGVVFENCRTTGYGGAISFYGIPDDYIPIIQRYAGRFVDCHADLGGGAISALYNENPVDTQTQQFFLPKDNANILIQGCTSEYGGAMYFLNVNLNFSCLGDADDDHSMIFKENYAEKYGSAIYIQGGIIDVDEGTCLNKENVVVEFQSNGYSEEEVLETGSIFDYGFSDSLLQDSYNGRISCEYFGTEELLIDSLGNQCFKDYFTESQTGENVLLIESSDYVLTPPIFASLSSPVEVPVRVLAGEKLSLEIEVKDMWGNDVPTFEAFTQVISFVDTQYIEYEIHSLEVLIGEPFIGIIFSKYIDISLVDSSNDSTVNIEENYVIQTIEIGLRGEPESEMYGTFSIPVWVGGCVPGYYRVEEDSFYSCYACPDLRYSSIEESPLCHECPQNAQVSENRDGVETDTDFWAYYDEENDGKAVVLFCPSGNCEGANVCVEGYNSSEPVCATCDYKYSQWGGSCIDCGQRFSFQSFLSISASVFSFFWNVHSTYGNSQDIENTIERIFSFFGQTYKFTMRNINWGSMLDYLEPILAVTTTLEAPSTTSSDDDDDDYSVDDDDDDGTSFYTDMIYFITYPVSWLVEILFDCPYRRSSYVVIWTGTVEPILLFLFVFFLLLVSMDFFCCGKCVCSPFYGLGLNVLFWGGKTDIGKVDSDEDAEEDSSDVSSSSSSVLHSDDSQSHEEEDDNDEEEGGEDCNLDSSSGEEEESSEEEEEEEEDLSEELSEGSNFDVILDDERKSEVKQYLKWEIVKTNEIGGKLDDISKKYKHLQIYLDKVKEKKDKEKEDLDEIISKDPLQYWLLCFKEELESRRDVDWSKLQKWGVIATGCKCVSCLCCLFERIFKKEKKNGEKYDQMMQLPTDSEILEDDPMEFVRIATNYDDIVYSESTSTSSEEEVQTSEEEEGEGDDNDETTKVIVQPTIKGEREQKLLRKTLSRMEDRDEYANLSLNDGDKEVLNCNIAELEVLKLLTFEYEKYLDSKFGKYFIEEEEEEYGNDYSVLNRLSETKEVEKSLLKEKKLLNKRKKQLKQKMRDLQHISRTDAHLETLCKTLKIPQWKHPPYFEIGPYLAYMCFGIPCMLICKIFGFLFRMAWNRFSNPTSFLKTLLNVTFITYQPILTNAMTVIDCFKFRNDEYRNNMYSDIVCYDLDWFAQFVFIFLIPLLYCVLYPIALFIFMVLKRRNLFVGCCDGINKFPIFIKSLFSKKRIDEEEEEKEEEKEEDGEVDNAFGLFYLCYRDKCWWYECASMVRKIVIVYLISYANTESRVNDLLLCIFFGFCLLFHIVYRPYKKAFDNFLEGMVFLVLFILQIICATSVFVRYEELAVAVVVITFVPPYLIVAYLKYRVSLLFILSKLEKFFIQKCFLTFFFCCCFPFCLWISRRCCVYYENDVRYDSFVVKERDWRGKVVIEDFMKRNQTWMELDTFVEENEI